jgi:hypothetical protein
MAELTKVTVKYTDQNSPCAVDIEDEDGFRRATAKFDGCIHYEEYEAGERTDYIHICDLPGHIEFLQSVLAAGKATFGPDWP